MNLQTNKVLQTVTGNIQSTQDGLAVLGVERWVRPGLVWVGMGYDPSCPPSLSGWD